MSYLPVWMEGLTPEMVEKAKLELGETSEGKQQALKELRQLINADAEFRPCMEDYFLLRFLRVRKYDVQKAYKILRNYYIFKAHYSGILTDFTPSDLLHVLKLNNFLTSPKRHPSGAVVVFARIGAFDIDKVTPEEMFAAVLILTEMVIESEATQVCGCIVCIDFSEMGLREVRHYASPTLLYRCVRLVQDCLPYRIKGFHFINEPFYFTILFNIVKALLSEKMSKRFFCHGKNRKSFQHYVPADICPTEFGGKMGPMHLLSEEHTARAQSLEAEMEKLNRFGYQGEKVQSLKRQNSRTLFS